MNDTKTKLKKMAKGAAIAGGAAAAVAALQMLSTLDLGQFQGLAVAIAAILINALRVFIPNGNGSGK